MNVCFGSKADIAESRETVDARAPEGVAVKIMFTAWATFILVGIVAIFAYHAGIGWRTGTVRFPMSLLVFQEFEREQSPENFWGIMVLNVVGYFVALAAAGVVAWGLLPTSKRPVDRLQSLNGCYEGQGLPDFMRPPMHWDFRVANGVIFDRHGKAVSNIRLGHSSTKVTPVTFSPGILISVDEHKNGMVYLGNTVEGKAYLSGRGARITVADEWGDLMQTTSCN